jgi:hypothetical protein
MEKFKNVVIVNDGIGGIINDLILGNMDTDYNDYNVGDRVTYEFYFDEDFEEDYCEVSKLREFVGEGICLEDKVLSGIWYSDIWYNVSVREESLLVEFEADETMCEKI